jgi:hypothetical protein
MNGPLVSPINTSTKKFNPFEAQRRKDEAQARRVLRRQYSEVEKSIISSTCYPYDRNITLKSEYPPGE